MPMARIKIVLFCTLCRVVLLRSGICLASGIVLCTFDGVPAAQFNSYLPLANIP